MSISDLIVVMKEGVVQQIGRPQEVYDSPANLFVAKFLGTPPINLFRGCVEQGKVMIGGETVLKVKQLADQQLCIGIRPEGFVLRGNGALGCCLGRVEVMGRDVSVVAEHTASESGSIRAIISAENRVNGEGAEVRFDVKPEKLFLFSASDGERIPFEPI